MLKDKLDNDVCDACGVAGEIGYLIQDGDEVATIVLVERGQPKLNELITKYSECAKNINNDVKVDITNNEGNTTLSFAFSATVEKIIFELKSRYIQ